MWGKGAPRRAVLWFRTGEFRLEVLVEGVLECLRDADDLVANVDTVVAIHAADLVQGNDIGAMHAHEL